MLDHQRDKTDGRNECGRKIGVRFVPAFASILMLTLTQMSAHALTPNEQRGASLARTYCARCHSTDKVTPSPLAIAPPFRELHKRYPVDDLAEGLAEGLVTGHPSMPEFSFAPDQIGDFIAFLKTLE